MSLQAKITTAQEILREAFETYDGRVGLSCSFGKDSVTVLHLAREFDDRVLAIYINTGLDFAETETFKEHLVERWKINIREFRPTQENIEYRESLDPNLNLSDPDLCCDLLKVEPNERALRDLDAWIVGLRRDETVFRQSLEPFEELERSDGRSLLRVAPIFNWTEAEVWDYIRSRDVPYHPLYDQGYRSMGCMPCSKAGLRGRFERSGRWDGSDKVECGIHTFLPKAGIENYEEEVRAVVPAVKRFRE